MTIEVTALRELARVQVRLKTLLAEHDHARLPAELVSELLDIIRRSEVVLTHAGGLVERKP